MILGTARLYGPGVARRDDIAAGRGPGVARRDDIAAGRVGRSSFSNP